jgi:hypothetical protein
MKTLGCLFFALAIVLGLAGQWCLMACLSWSAFQAWTWNDDDDMED